MKRVPIFPIPGNGLYLRQPLYAGDLCNIIIACVQRPRTGEIFNVSGLEKIDYIDMVRAIRDVIGSRTFIAPIPFSIFAFLLNTYALFDRNPPFTTKQLQALVIPEVFETIDWPQIFGVPSTPFRAAISETFHHPVYSKMDLEF
jgi:nucleoside-diphosphate-sugar epimerase